MGFKLKSGNTTSFKSMGGTDKSPAKDMKTGSYKQSFESPAKHFVDDVPEHNDGHSDDLQTPEEHDAGKSPAKQTATTWADGTKKSARDMFNDKETAIEQRKTDRVDNQKSPYWFKINGKKVTHAQYKAYENKPGGDEPGKQTNHPDAMGYKAKHKADRVKLNK